MVQGILYLGDAAQELLACCADVGKHIESV